MTQTYWVQQKAPAGNYYDSVGFPVQEGMDRVEARKRAIQHAAYLNQLNPGSAIVVSRHDTVEHVDNSLSQEQLEEVFKQVEG